MGCIQWCSWGGHTVISCKVMKLNMHLSNNLKIPFIGIDLEKWKLCSHKNVYMNFIAAKLYKLAKKLGEKIPMSFDRWMINKLWYIHSMNISLA